MKYRHLLIGKDVYKRQPYSLESGGVGSGIWKTTNGGASWIDISRNKGLPKDTLGIIGLSISASNPNKYYAIVESKTGGVFTSNDAGKTWEKTNEENKPVSYTHLFYFYFLKEFTYMK